MSTLYDMFGIEPPSTSALVTETELADFLSELVLYVYTPGPMGYGEDPNATDLTRSLIFLDRRADLAERRLLLLRHALNYAGDLTERSELHVTRRVGLTHGELRSLLVLLEVRLASILTDEPPRALPWDGSPFR